MEADAATQWQSFARKLGEIGCAVHAIGGVGRSERQRHEWNQHMLWTLATAALAMSQLDPDLPDWVPLMNSGSRACNPSPDTTYLITRLRAAEAYRITARLGTVNKVILSIHDGFMGFTKNSSTLGTYDLQDEHFDRNSGDEIEIFLSSCNGFEKKNWIDIGTGSDEIFVLIRQISCDKDELDGKFTIERLGPHAPLRAPDAGFGRRLEDVADYVSEMAQSLLALIEEQRGVDFEINQMRNYSKVLSDKPTMREQIYFGGEVCLERNQVLLIEFKVPEICSYWSVQLMDSAYNALDFMNFQSGLNKMSAETDFDGYVRIAVSEEDPGLYNWLDKGDYDLVGIRWRFLSNSAPELECKMLPASEVRHLVRSRNISGQRRKLALRERLEAAQRRRRW